MATNVRKERTRGVPRTGGLLTVSAVLLMAGPVVDWLLSRVMEDYYSSISIFFCLLAVAGGVLLLTARERKAGCAVGGKLQLLAKIGGALCLVLGILGVVLILLGVLVLLLQLVGLIPSGFEPTSLMLGGLIGVVSALLLAVSTWPLYAFGQITADLHAIRKGGISASAPESTAQPAASRENPDELPEL